MHDQFWADVAASSDEDLLTAAADLAPQAQADDTMCAIFSALCNELITRHGLDRAAIETAGASITDAIRAEIRAAQILRASTN